MTDDSCKPSRSAGSVPRACTPFSPPPPTSSVPVVAPPVFVPVSPVMPVMTVSGAAPDRFGNVDIRPFVRTVLDQALLDLDLFAPFLARIVESGTFAPASGISRDALGPAVRASLDLADSAVQDVSGKADKAVPSAAGNIASLGADGNLVDSGKAPSDFAPASHASDGSIHHTAVEIGQIAAGEVAKVVANAPAALDTLKEIADVIGTESGQTAGGILKRVADLETGKADKSEMSVTPGTGADAGKTTIQLKDGTSATVLTEHQDVSGKADKSEMSVTPGTGADAGKTTIQLKGGTSATVLTEHQDVSGKADKSEMSIAAVSGYADRKTIQLKAGASATVLTEHQDVSGKLDGAAAYPVWDDSSFHGYWPSGTVVSWKGRLYRSGEGGTANPVEPGTPEGADDWAEITLQSLLATKANASDVNAALAQKASLTDLPYAMVTPGELGEWEFSDGGTHVIIGPTGAGGVWFYSSGPSHFSNTFSSEAAALSALELTFTDASTSDPSDPFTATRSSLPGHLCDRANNLVPVTANTTLILPPSVAGKVRDFYLKMTVTGSRQVSFLPATGITYTGLGDPSRTYSAGTYLFRFTETSPNEFHVEDMLAPMPDATKADKVSGATAGNLAALTAQGNLADSGAKPSDFATPSDLPYALVTPGEWETDADSGFDLSEISGPHYDDGWYYVIGLCFSQKFNSEAEARTALTLNFVDPSGLSEPSIFTATRASLPGHLLDRAVNAVPVSSATTLTLPALANAGRSRDFYVKMTVTGSQSVTFSPSTGITYTGFGDPSRTYSAGTYLLHFTETSENEFCVTDMLTQKQDKLSEAQMDVINQDANAYLTKFYVQGESQEYSFIASSTLSKSDFAAQGVYDTTSETWTKNITSIQTGTNVTTLETNLFKDVTTMTYFEGTEVMFGVGGAQAFGGCTGLHFLILPKIRTLPANICKDCTALTSLTIPSSLISIGRSAFLHCSNLSVHFEEKSLAEVQAMLNYPWGLTPSNITASKTATQEWVEEQLPEYAAAHHEHSADDITSGTLNAARLPIATDSSKGVAQVDGTTIAASSGTISVKPEILSYSLATPEPSNGVVTLVDRANNLIDATTGIVTLTLPLFEAGKVRDMLVACTIGLDANDDPWSVIFQGQGSEAPSGADEISFKAEGDDASTATFPVPDAAGDWWYSLTERAPHVFAVSLKQLQSVSQLTQTQGGS